MGSKNIKRGEIYWADFSGTKSYKEKKKRPVIILQNNLGNKKLLTTIVAPATTTIKSSNPVIVQIPKNVCGMKENSFFLIANILTIEQNILGGKIGDVTLSIMGEIEKAIKLSLGLEDMSEHPFYKYR